MVSVIIPVYNVEKYLKECLDSIINQTYKDIEILIVNDGSTDGSLNICNKYAEKDKRIQIISQNNEGLSAARNAAIKIAKGEYLTFVDSDDFISLDMIEYLYLMLNESNADMAVCQHEYVDEKSNKLSFKKIRSNDRVIIGNRNCMKEFFCSFDIDTVAWAKLYRTSYFENIKFPIGKYHEDIFTTYLIVEQCEKIVIGKKKKYSYRQRYNSISKKSFSEKHLDAVKGNLEREAHIAKIYPELRTYARAKVIYAANQCSIKMSTSKNYDSQTIKFLQDQYRNYEFDFLKGNSSIIAKIYSVFAWINLKFLIYLLSMIL